jgi:hypothetical protein
MFDMSTPNACLMAAILSVILLAGGPSIFFWLFCRQKPAPRPKPPEPPRPEPERSFAIDLSKLDVYSVEWSDGHSIASYLRDGVSHEVHYYISPRQHDELVRRWCAMRIAGELGVAHIGTLPASETAS